MHKTSRLLLITGAGSWLIAGTWIAASPLRPFWAPPRTAWDGAGFAVALVYIPFYVFGLLLLGLHLLLAASLRRRITVFVWLFALQCLLGVLYLAGGLAATPFIPLPLRPPQQAVWYTNLVAQWWGVGALAVFLVAAPILDRLVVPRPQQPHWSRDGGTPPPEGSR